MASRTSNAKELNNRTKNQMALSPSEKLFLQANSAQFEEAN
jgi:hypothetical protein